MFFPCCIPQRGLLTEMDCLKVTMNSSLSKSILSQNDHISDQARMARGIHGLPKVSTRPTMPNPLRPAGGPPPKRPYGPVSDL
jgi:hypothetical protein